MASRNKQFLTMFWVWRTLSNTCTLNMFHKPFGEIMLLKKWLCRTAQRARTGVDSGQEMTESRGTYS